jgi:hypothetical protein
LLNEPGGVLQAALLECGDAGKMQGLGMTGVGRENLAVKLFRLRHLPALVIGKRCRQYSID